MMLERTITQLDVGHVPDHIAEEMGHLGYAQWLGALNGNAGYFAEAIKAFERAQPFVRTSPAVAVFCHLLIQSTASPPAPLTLKLPVPTRRGGAKARRAAF